MVVMLMMYRHQKHQQKEQQNKWKNKSSKSGEVGGGDFLDTLYQTRTSTTRGSSCRVGGGGGSAGRSIVEIWFVLVVFMLILCGNTVISQQRTINSNNNSNSKLNNSSNILLQISTPPYNNKNNNNNDGTAGVGGIIVVVDEVEKQVFNSTKTTTSTTSSSSSSSTAVTSSLSSSSSSSAFAPASSNNAPTLGITNTDTKTINLSSNNDSSLNDGESVSSSSSSSRRSKSSTSNSNNSNEDLFNSSEILDESEDVYENSSISPTTYRPLRASIGPQLSSAQERERRLMNVLAARRSALQRPGFRNRIGTTGRTATAVETTSKSPTDPRSICIRNCTKNFTRRTTASCMRQCANFSRVANTSNIQGGGAGVTSVVVRASSKTGLGTSQAGERDTNEILFTDESSHGLLVIAKEQNDTLNHITDEIKGGTASKLRGRRKPSQAGTVTLATTSIEDDEIQPYLYFGQKLPPLKPNALTITSVSDEHPKLLEVSVADELPSSTTPVSLSYASTLSAVERSRARFKYNMRNGVNFNRRYSTINRATTPEVPTDLRSTTLRIVAKPNIAPVKAMTDQNSELPSQMKNVSLLRTVNEAIKEEPLASSTPLIITVLSDEEMITAITDTIKEDVIKSYTIMTTTTPIESTTSTTTEKPTTTTTSTTTSTTTPSTSSTTTTTTTTTTTPVPFIYQAPKITFTTSTAPTTTSSTSTPISTTTKKSTIIDEDTELLRKLGPSLTQPINTNEKTNLIIFVNRTSGVYRPRPSTTTMKPLQVLVPNLVTTDSSTILRTTVLTSIRSTVNPRTKDFSISTTPVPMPSSQKGPVLSGFIPSSSTIQPLVTGEISSTVVTDNQDISLEMQRMNIVTMVLAGIGIVPLLAIILYLLRNYLLKRPIKDDEDFDVCIADQQPISPVKKLESKYQDDDEDEVDHHKKPAQRQHSLHSKLVSAPLSRDNNHNITMSQQQQQQQQQQQHQRYDDKSSISSDHEFDRSNIRLKSLLGEGNFGQVWKAEADDLSGHFGATRIVAVKTIKACSTQLSLKDEANIMRKLGSHQNVVTLLGACVESEPHMLIMEYAMRGRLLSLLRAARNATNILPASVPGGRSLAPLSPRTLAGFCLDIACGMEYISGKRIVHRDLAARNVLLDHNGVCKICDFGMSIDLDAERKRKEQEKNCANEIISRSNFNKFKFDFGGKFIMNHWTPHTTKDINEKKSHGHDTIGKRPALPIRWMAPESLQYNMFSTETDIWAFGIVLWEIATLGSTPYSQITGREVIRRVPQGLRPDLPKEGRHEFYNLMSRCWHKDSQMRPSFSQCRLEIARSLHKWVDDDSAASDYMDVSGFSEDLEQGMVYFNHRISEFECEI